VIGVGDRLPQATVAAPEPVELAELVGAEPTLLVFFKEGCDTSRIGLPVFQHWSGQVRVLGMSQDDPASTAAFFAEAGIDMEVAYDHPGYQASAAFDLDGVPALFLVEDGEITWSWLGWNTQKAEELADRLAAMTGTARVLVGAGGLPPLRPG
jgi:peroxiredoxin